MYRDKLLNRKKNFGRCLVNGHGSNCEVSKEIQSQLSGKAKEKREYQKLIDEDRHEQFFNAVEYRKILENKYGFHPRDKRE